MSLWVLASLVLDFMHHSSISTMGLDVSRLFGEKIELVILLEHTSCQFFESQKSKVWAAHINIELEYLPL